MRINPSGRRLPDRRTLGVLGAGAGAVALAAAAATATIHAGAGTVADTSANNPATCTTGYQPRTGYDLDVCLAANGTTVTPSLNVHHLGDTSSSCTITLEIWDDANNKLGASTPVNCATGPFTGTALDLSTLTATTAHTAPDGSLTLHAFARLTIDGQGVYISGQGDSPTVTMPSSSPSAGGSSGAAAPGPPAGSIVATALQDTKTDNFSALRTDLTSMSGADMDAYLTQLGASGRQGLNALATKGYSQPVQLALTNTMLTRASASTIQASKQDLTFWQPALDTRAASGVTWSWNQTTPALFPSAGPSVQDASQGVLNDCYFHAELLAIVQSHQAWLSDHIVANSNATVTVTFYQNGTAAPVTVTTDLPYNGSKFPYGGTRTSSWMALYEKAYAQLLGGYPSLNGESITSAQAWTGAAYGALTGSPDTRVGGFGLQPGVAIGNPLSLQTVSQWLATGDVVTTSTYPGGATNDRFPVTVASQDPGTSGQQLQGVVPAHEYTVVNVDTTNSTLTLLNPWGPGLTWPNNQASIPFEFTITTADYQKYFMDAAYDLVPDPIAAAN
jgi:hypothetical protein